MGYRVEYGPEARKRKPGKARLAGLAAVGLLLLLLLGNRCRTEGRETIRQWLLPGDGAVTAGALEDFAWELGEGAELSRAFEVFCRKVLWETADAPD